MGRHYCGARDWSCNWTDLSTTYKNNNRYSVRYRLTLLQNCTKCVKELKAARSYIPSNIYNNWLNRVNFISKNRPNYLISANKGSYKYCKHRIRYWFFGWRSRCVDLGTQYYWDLNVINNALSQLRDLIKEVQRIRNDIPKQVYNNCGNPYTLLDQNGMVKCGTQQKLDTQKKWIETTNMTDANKSVMNSIKNTKDFPQYNLANNRNRTITTMYDWNPMDSRSSYNSNYASMRKKDIENRINQYNRNIPKQYNKCSYSNTSISVDNNGVPQCVTSDYNSAIENCSIAYEQSQVYKYGSDKLMQLWTDVSNNIPGNTMNTNRTVLNAANDSCKKWVEMFNEWQKKEEEALIKPCAPERPITSDNDKVISAMIEEWYANSTNQIETLTDKLDSLKEKLKNVPQLLELKPENVREAPPGITGTVSVKKRNVPIGELPVQYLEIILPTGEQGDTGESGAKGIQGIPGIDGIRGDVGISGKPIVPDYFNYNK